LSLLGSECSQIHTAERVLHRQFGDYFAGQVGRRGEANRVRIFRAPLHDVELAHERRGGCTIGAVAQVKPDRG
jgi:hypothetical protein